jgi:hypothetical protein
MRKEREMRVRTLHDIEIEEVREMVRSLEAGKSLPVVHCVDMGEYIKALEGTHRLLAYLITGKEPEIEMIDYEENKDKPINDIIGDTDGDNDFDFYTLEEFIERFETTGDDLKFVDD